MRNAEATRERLVQAARRIFSERGYERTTVREIAAQAEVNPALINRYFGGKEQLFAEAVSVDLALPDLSGLESGRIGLALAAHFFRRWEGAEHDDLLRTLIRTAATNPEAAVRIREILGRQVAPMISRVAGSERLAERAYLVATQILGLAYARYVINLSDDDIARDTLVAAIGETLQRYLTAPLQ
ncbi:TetR/AcrR family transcriptional regulator [Pseudorhizobium halotolerans]|uniref:TetR/AcrR family transcriptional regulator n=1 Tax=Pseudorhizobium halotolerans TaxID=1233081 RepID=A0ABM8PY95_9HYPH|nr:TetR family transcriptional regulator [Pseudorhizobium halotolerans]CAD7054702.1 TetR/AcrR family transcriptional regulator [Pseudorhizobium halotolerans]